MRSSACQYSKCRVTWPLYRNEALTRVARSLGSSDLRKLDIARRARAGGEFDIDRDGRYRAFGSRECSAEPASVLRPQAASTAPGEQLIGGVEGSPPCAITLGCFRLLAQRRTLA